MLHALSLQIVHARVQLGTTALLGVLGIARLALRIIPRGHPLRIYFEGRFCFTERVLKKTG